MQIMCNCINCGVCLLQVVIYSSFVVLASNKIQAFGQPNLWNSHVCSKPLCGIIKQGTSLSMLM